MSGTPAKGAFSVRTANALNAVFGDALTLEELAAMPDCDLRRWKRIGKKALAEIRDVCAKKLGDRLTGRTTDFESVNTGSKPVPRTKFLNVGEALALLWSPLGVDVRLSHEDAEAISDLLYILNTRART